jgi:hypothetical protein
MAMSKRFLCTLLLSALLAGSASAADWIVVANPGVPAETMSSAQLKRVYLGRMQLWNNQVRVKPAYVSVKTEQGEAVFEHAIQMDPQRFQRLWIKKTFSGEGIPPVALGSADRVIDYVSNQDGAVGLIPRPEAEIPSSVKVVEITEED